MEERIRKAVRFISLTLAFLTAIWIIFTGISMSQVKSSWSDYDYLQWVSCPDVFYSINYINATILTLAVIALFTILFMYLYAKNKMLALLGFIFVPVYGLLNIVCYSVQITIIPSIANHVISNSGDIFLAAQLIQSRNGTIISFINALAYSILAIPSIVYGYMLIKAIKKLSGMFLLINGILCIIGIIGYMLNNTVMSSGVMLGGIAFLLSLLFMIFDFSRAYAEHIENSNTFT